MTRLVELGRTLAEGMDGINPRYAVRVRPFSTHEEAAASAKGGATFEISEVSFQVPVGTYIDAPRTRDPGARDIAALRLDELVLPGVYVDLHGHGARSRAEVVPADLPDPSVLAGCALVVDFGRARHYGTPAYDEAPPYFPRVTVEHLLKVGVKILAVDTRSPDGPDPEKPAHTLFLRADCFIVENLTGLEALRGKRFRFFAIPLRVKDATSFPIRAFAEILD